MTYSKTHIYNLALNALAISAPIAHASQNDTRAIILSNSYEIARDTVLEDFDWGFAEFYKDLAFTVEKSLNPRYKYQFDCPNDCVAARSIIDIIDGKEKRFHPSSGINGQKVVLTDINPCRLRYTRRVEKEIFFSAGFTIAFSQYLAGLCGEVLTGSRQKAEGAMQKYSYLIQKAQRNSASEGSKENEDDTTWLNARD